MCLSSHSLHLLSSSSVPPLSHCLCMFPGVDVDVAGADVDVDAHADVVSDADAAFASYTYEPYPCDDYDSDRNNMPAA